MPPLLPSRRRGSGANGCGIVLRFTARGLRPHEGRSAGSCGPTESAPPWTPNVRKRENGTLRGAERAVLEDGLAVALQPRGRLAEV